MRIVKYQTQLVKEAGFNYEATAMSPEEVYRLLEKAFNAPRRCEEHSWQICTDVQGRAVGLFELATGTRAACYMDPAAVARNAILTNASGVIISHNHPSGNASPSKDDLQATARVKEALALFGITLFDHVIIGDGQYTSLRERGAF